MVEVRAHTEGGDGAVAQIQITGNKGHLHRLQSNGVSGSREREYLSARLTSASDLISYRWTVPAAETSGNVGTFYLSQLLPGVGAELPLQL